MTSFMEFMYLLSEVTMSGGSLMMPSNGSVNRLQERLDLKELHDQLVHYIQHVQDLKYKANSVDSSAFIDSIKVMEDSVISLRSSYEKELNKARYVNFS